MMWHSGDWEKTSRRARSPNAVQAREELNKNRSSRDQTQEEKSKMRRQIIVITEKMEDTSQLCRPATTARAAGKEPVGAEGSTE